jgi:glycosyltransferase involved in cell wall biosynthesis
VNLLRLLQQLDRSRFDLHLFVTAPGSMRDRAEALGVTTHVVPLRHPRVGKLYRAPQSLRAIAELYLHLRRLRTQVLYVDGADHVWPAWTACRGLGIRLVWHAQTSFVTRYDRSILARADVAVAVSHAVARRLERLTTRTRVITIVNAVDTARFVPPPEGRPRQASVLLYVGEFSPLKGIDDLCHAVALLAKELPAIRLRIAGSGDPDQTGRLRQLVQSLGISRNVEWLGQQSDVASLLQSASIFVFPSHSEGLSLALLEAMACACPIVATAIPGNAEALGDDAGELVPVASPLELAGAVRELLSNPARAAEMGARARARTCQAFALSRYVEDFSRLFESLADDRA